MYYSLISSMSKGLSDAEKFILAAGITDATQKTAITTLVDNLKLYGIWNKIKALYPMVGGTAASHKFNLKDPRDLNAAYRLTFNGGWTHSSTGALPNGTNGYANTFLIPSTYLTINNSHVSFYSRSSVIGATRESIGSVNGGFITSTQLIIKWSDNSFYLTIDNNIDTPVYTNANTLGYYIGSRTLSNLVKGYKNGNIITSGNSNSVGQSSNVLYIGARNRFGNSDYYDNKETAFASIGDGLTDTEASNFYTAVQSYQTSLSRQV